MQSYLAWIRRFAAFHGRRHPAQLGASEVAAFGYDIRAVQELLGHRNLATMMLYLHVMRLDGLGVRRPADLLGAERRLEVRQRSGAARSRREVAGSGPVL